jgi:hypothetical protein
MTTKAMTATDTTAVAACPTTSMTASSANTAATTMGLSDACRAEQGDDSDTDSPSNAPNQHENFLSSGN